MVNKYFKCPKNRRINTKKRKFFPKKRQAISEVPTTEKKESALLNYFKLIVILIVPAIFITWYSFNDNELEIGNVILEKTTIANYFHFQTDSSLIAVIDSIILTPKDSIIHDTLPKRILFFGDSMVEGLSRRMRQYAAENDHELLNVIWYSSSSKVWAENIDTLKHFMRTFKPDYIFICLGGNELFVRDLPRRDTYVKTIIQTIDTIPFVWIGPPNWKNDTGINQIIEDNVGRHRFFPSKRLTYKRLSDGAHPTTASASVWMDSVACWIKDSIKHRIVMEVPQNKDQSGRTVMLQPPK